MGKFILDIPEELHNKLRHKSVDEKKDMRDLIIDGIKERLIKPIKKRKVIIRKGESTINFELLFWSPVQYPDRKEMYKRKKFFNYYDGQITLKDKGKVIEQQHFHSAGQMLKILEELYRRYVDTKLTS